VIAFQELHRRFSEKACDDEVVTNLYLPDAEVLKFVNTAHLIRTSSWTMPSPSGRFWIVYSLAHFSCTQFVTQKAMFRHECYARMQSVPASNGRYQ